MIKPLFLFGTLLHAPLRDLVAGEAVTSVPAILAEYRVCAVRDQAFPLLVADTSGQVDGLLITDMSDTAMARIDFYETIFGYTRHEITVLVKGTETTADVYLPPEGQWQTEGLWDFEAWVAEHAALNLLAAEEVMQRRGVTPSETLAHLYPFIRARAASRHRAMTDTTPLKLRRQAKPDDIAFRNVRTPHEGFFRLRTFQVKTRQYDGGEGDWADRETFMGYDAGLVLPYDPRSDLVLLVEQARYAPYWRGDAQPFILEPVAGIVDAGETPEETVLREAREEAGLEIDRLIHAGSGYPAPGYVGEFHYCYIGICELSQSQAGLGGLDSEHEDIRSHVIPFETAMELVKTGEINALPLIMLLYRLAQDRDRLQADLEAGAAQA